MSTRRTVVILGSSGSIGENALRVARKLNDRIQVAGLAVRSNYKRALQQAGEFGVDRIAVADEEMARLCCEEAGSGMTVYCGEAGVSALAALPNTDMVLCSVVGMAGLRPVLAALENGTDVALATKEVLVVAGSLVMRLARERGARILPVDSEHSAIFQCLGPEYPGNRNQVAKLWLTASGGPFESRPEVDLDKVSVDEALAHPRWDMGSKVTIDSATLMNKGLEIMEAQWLFDMKPDEIGVIVHPESIVHSMVEYIDGSLIAQLSEPDMRLAIQYAFTYPRRCHGDLPRLNLARAGALHFREPDLARFPALSLARRAAGEGGTMPAVLNAANEVAVERFLRKDTTFAGIPAIVERVMNSHEPVRSPAIEDIEAADAWARNAALAVRP